jgi:hypothetical protein
MPPTTTLDLKAVSPAGGGGERPGSGGGAGSDSADAQSNAAALDEPALIAALDAVTAERDQLARDVEALCLQHGGGGGGRGASRPAPSGPSGIAAALSGLGFSSPAAAGGGGRRFAGSAVLTGRVQDLEAELAALRKKVRLGMGVAVFSFFVRSRAP